MKRKRFTSLLLTVIMVLQLCTPTAVFAAGETIIKSGTCGTDLTWTLNSAGTLTVSGNGAIPDYTLTGYYTNSPWDSFADDYGVVTSIVVEEGVTAIGDYAFYDCYYAQTLSLPSTVTDIGAGALERMGNLETVSVAPGNPSYTALDGVLYNKDVTTLIRAGRVSDPFVMPSTVTEIAPKALEDAVVVNLVLSSNLKEIGDNMFEESSIQTITNAGSIERIGNNAFANCGSLTEISGLLDLKSIGDNAFHSCYELTNLSLPEGLEHIGASAFFKCYDYRVTIPSTVAEIGENAFRETYSVSLDADNESFCIENGLLMNTDRTTLLLSTSAANVCVIPETVVDIYPGAFFRNLSLTEVFIPSGVKELRERVFEECNLRHIHFSEGLEVIHDNAFYSLYNSPLSLTIPASVTTIGNAFQALGKLKSIYFLGDAPTFPEKGTLFGIPDDITLYYLPSASGWTSPVWKGYNTEVWDGTYPDSDMSWTLINGVLTISGSGELAAVENQAPWWHQRDSITNVVVSEGITNVDDSLFRDLNNMRTLSLPATYTPARISLAAYPALRKVTVAAGNPKYTSSAGAVYSADMTVLYAVAPALTGTFTVPDGVTKINFSAFRNCSQLTEITIPASVSVWNNYPSSSFSADYSCNSLAQFTVDNGNPAFCSVDGVLFSKDRTRLLWVPPAKTGHYQVPAETTTINYNALLDSSLTTLDIHANVTGIGAGTSYISEYPRNVRYAFGGWDNMTGISVDSGNAKYCTVDGVLYTKDKTTLYAIPNGITELTIPDTVQTSPAYSQPKDLKILHLGESCSRIAFEQFPALEQVTVHEDNLNFYVVDNVVYSRDMKTLYWCPRDYSGVFEIPDGVTSISSYAFQNCTGLTDVIFPDSLNSIGSSAFQNCVGLTSLQLKGVRIGEATFGDCDNLTTVTLDGATIPAYAFAACDKLTNVTLSGAYNIEVNAFAYTENLDHVTAVGNPPSNLKRGAFSRVGQDFVIQYTQASTPWPTPFMGYQTQPEAGCGAGRHSEVIDAAVAPDCTNPGLTEGKHCDKCGKVLVAQNPIPETGHDWIPATTQAPKTCSVCGATEGDPILSSFAGGSGTVSDPYQITSPEQLNNVRNYPDSHFVLLNDIKFTDDMFEAGGAFYNDGRFWTPIPYFSGVLDGQGYTVSGLKVNVKNTSTTESYAGVFARSSGVIENLNLSDMNVKLTGHGAAGSLIGNMTDGSIRNISVEDCVVSVKNSDGNPCAGGIIGDAFSSDSTISNCSNGTSVTAEGDTLTGSSYYVYAGGIAGRSSAAISGCSNSGTVTATGKRLIYETYAGGITAYSSGTIIDCCNSGSVSASCGRQQTCSAAGIAAYMAPGMTDCENTGEISAVASISGTAFAAGIAVYLNTYGTGEAARLKNSGKVWVESPQHSRAAGIAVFLYSTLSNCENNGAIGNLSTYDASGIVAYSTSGDILDCRNTGTITGHMAAGITSQIYGIYRKIARCYNTGSIAAAYWSSSGSCIGGIVASCYGADIENCYNAGELSNANRSGGIAGEFYTDGSGIISCYNVGKINGSTTGGIVGRIDNVQYCSNNYYLDTCNFGFGDSTDSPHATRCTDAEMRLRSTYVGFDFDIIWSFNPIIGYPYPMLTNAEVVGLEPLENQIGLYVPGGDVILAGMKATATLADGSSVVIDITESMLADFDKTCEDEQLCFIALGDIMSQGTVLMQPHQHIWEDYITISAPTCIEPGLIEYICPCSMTLPEEIPSYGHSFTSYQYNHDATCTANGTETAYCGNSCGAEDIREVANTMLPHAFTDYQYNGDASCTADGTKTARCDNCDAQDTQEAEDTKLNHLFTQYIDQNNSTCTVMGSAVARCDYGCGTTDVTPNGYLAEHSYDAPTFHWNDICTAAVAVHTCLACKQAEQFDCTVTMEVIDHCYLDITASAVISGQVFTDLKYINPSLSLDSETGALAGTLNLPFIPSEVETPILFFIAHYDASGRMTGFEQLSFTENKLELAVRNSYSHIFFLDASTFAPLFPVLTLS